MTEPRLDEILGECLEHSREEWDERVAAAMRAHPGLADDLARALGVAKQIDRPIETAEDERVPGYELLELVGVGGMGRVFRAHEDGGLDREVAIKLIKPGMDSAAVLRRFGNERKTLAQLQHPNIATILSAGLTSLGRPYFALEFIDGLPLVRFCDVHSLGLPDRVRLFCKVCAAISHAHERRVIHRDIKPSNVLVRMIDGEAVPSVIDFGLSRALDVRGELDESRPTMQGQFIGTPEFMSPEQARGDIDRVDERSDVYSLGVMLFELLVGLMPFSERQFLGNSGSDIDAFLAKNEITPPSRRSSVAEGARARASARRCTPSRLASTLKGPLDWVVMKAVRYEPQERYASVSALADDLRAYLESRRTVARPRRIAVRRVSSLVRSRRGGALLLVLAAVAATLIALERASGTIEAGTPDDEIAIRSGSNAERLARGVDLVERGRALLANDAPVAARRSWRSELLRWSPGARLARSEQADLRSRAGTSRMRVGMDCVTERDRPRVAIADSSSPELSADGRWVTFVSVHPFVREDEDFESDAYRFDRWTGEFRLCSPSSAGEGGGTVEAASVSGDGATVVFRVVCAIDAIEKGTRPGDAWRTYYVHDCVTGATRALHPGLYTPHGIQSGVPIAVSHDGRWVAVHGVLASDDELRSGRLEPQRDNQVWMIDTWTGEARIVSTSASGEPADGMCYTPSMSADGRLVAFACPADNLVPTPGPAPVVSQVFLKDVVSGEVELVSAEPDGRYGEGHSARPIVSASGARVAYLSDASFHVEGAGHHLLVIVHDRATGSRSVIPRTFDGRPVVGHESLVGGLTLDGGRLVFSSVAPNLIPWYDRPALSGRVFWDSFVHDLASGSTARLNVPWELPRSSSGGAHDPFISDDGRTAVFKGMGDATVPDRGAAPGAFAIYLADLRPAPPDLFECLQPTIMERLSSLRSSDVAVDADGDLVAWMKPGLDGTRTLAVESRGDVLPMIGPPLPFRECNQIGLSADGRRLAFAALPNRHVEARKQSVFVLDVPTGHIHSEIAKDPRRQTWVGAPALSGDASHLAYCEHLTGDREERKGRVLRRSLVSGEDLVVSEGYPTVPPREEGQAPGISEDGRHIAFLASDESGMHHNARVILWSETAEGPVTVDVLGGLIPRVQCHMPRPTADGTRVFFDARPRGPGLGTWDVFRWSRAKGLECLTRDWHDGKKSDDWRLFGISADGRRILVGSRSETPLRGNPNRRFDVYLLEDGFPPLRVTAVGWNWRANQDTTIATISADGSTVLLRTHATNVEAVDPNSEVPDVWRVDVDALRRASQSPSELWDVAAPADRTLRAELVRIEECADVLGALDVAMGN
ncbi:MAG: protein kinase [Planctomycetota bacterium]